LPLVIPSFLCQCGKSKSLIEGIMNTSTFKNMSTTERLQAMEALWDSILYEEEEISPPKWHREIIEERKKKIENGTAEFISIAKLKASHR